jgi:uncharacterized protein YyaL (SSP411 family)
MGNAASKVLSRASFLTLGLLLAAVSGAAAGPLEWSAEAFATARQQGRTVIVLVTDPRHAAAEAAWRADPAVSARLSSDFVDVRVDRVLRPDVAEILGLAVRERTGFEGLPLLAASTADGTPFLGLTGARALDPGEWPAFANAAAALLRSQPDARWSAAVAAVRAAQKPSPALRPLDVATVEAATRAAIAAPELGGTDGPFPHAAIDLLLAESRRARRPELVKLGAIALDLRLARPRSATPGVAEQAMALATWARAHDVAGRATYGAATERLAAEVRGQARADGCLPESAADARVIAETNGLAIGALALSGRVAGRGADADAARRAAACVLARLGSAASLSRGDGTRSGSAFLGDYAALALGLLELHEATGEAQFRADAQALADAAIGRFLDVEGGAFFLTDAAHEPSLARLKHAFDGALPPANATMARALVRLARATGEPRYADLARRTVEAFAGDLQRAPRALLALAAAASDVLGPAPAAAATDASAPAVVTRGRVTMHVRSVSVPVVSGGTADLEVEFDVAAGAFVIAHGVRARDLAGLGVSVPSEGVRSATPRYPVASTVRVPGSAPPLAAYQGRVVVAVRVTLARDVPAGPRRLRVRVLFQECDASACRTPDGAVLEVPVTVVAR